MLGISTLSAKQALRMRRFLMAWGMYSISMLIIGTLAWQNYLSMEHFTAIMLLVMLINFGFYLIFHFNINLRFRDPSLTTAQILVATVLLNVIAYHTDGGRGIILLLYLSSHIFGIYKLSTNQFLRLNVVAVLSYGGTIALLVLRRPEAIDLNLELVHWAALALLLPTFSVIGGHMSALREQLHSSNHELKAAVERISELAITDDLTGINNRRQMMNLIRGELERVERSQQVFSIALIDLDHFKQINDQYGHVTGDNVLGIFAKALDVNSRTMDSVGRYGGEEFLLIMPETQADVAETVVKRLQAMTAKLRFKTLDKNSVVRFSAGVTAYHLGDDLESLLSRADRALYQAKESGRNQIRLLLHPSACTDSAPD